MIRVAAIAPWFRLRLPSCGPGFESQAHHLCFKKNLLNMIDSELALKAITNLRTNRKAISRSGGLYPGTKSLKVFQDSELLCSGSGEGLCPRAPIGGRGSHCCAPAERTRCDLDRTHRSRQTPALVR